MYIIYPPKEKNWKHHLLTLLVLAMFFPLLKMGGFLPEAASQPAPAEPSLIYFEESYHNLTNKIIEQIGFLGFVGAFFQGSEIVNGVYPLYPALLLTVAQTNFSDFVTNAVALNFLMTLFFLLLFFWTLRRTEGEVFGLLAVCFLFLSPNFVQAANQFGPEILILFCVYLSWFNLAEETELDGLGLSCGIWTAATLLTTPFGGALFFGVLLFFVISYNYKLFKQKSLWNFLTGFTLIASLLLFRDFWLYQNPFLTLTDFFKELSFGFGPLLQFPHLWPLFVIGFLGLLFDQKKRRRNLSFIVVVISLLGSSPLTLLLILAFYAAAVVHLGLAKLLNKGLIWLGLILATAICTWSWSIYL